MKSKRRQLEALRGAWKLETPAWLHEWLHRSDTVTARRIIEAEDPKAFLKNVPRPGPEKWASLTGRENSYAYAISVANDSAWVEIYFSLAKDALQMRVSFVGVEEDDEPYDQFWRFEGDPLTLVNGLYQAVREVERGVATGSLRTGLDLENAFREAVKAKVGNPS